MMSIESIFRTIRTLTEEIRSNGHTILVALIGGYASVLHGVERTTADVDFLVHSSLSHDVSVDAFAEFLQSFFRNLSFRVDIQILKGAHLRDDPFGHDVIILKGPELGRVDLVFARYRWELEALRQAVPYGRIGIPVVGKPYLIAMKLLGGSFKDYHDIQVLYRTLSADEKRRAFELARRIHRDRVLKKIVGKEEGILPPGPSRGK